MIEQSGTSSGTPAAVSLIVATYGRSAELKPLLTSLVAQTDHLFEIIVVDQNVDERVTPVLDAARTDGLAIKHVRVDKPGLAAARNVGTAEATGEIIAYPDDDCWYEPDVIARVRAAFRNAPDTSGIVGRWVEMEPEQPRAPHRLTYDAWSRFRGGYAASITLFFSREKLQTYGGFDPRLGAGRWYGSSEETDLLLRMLREHEPIDHVPRIHIHHAVTPAPSATRSNLARARAYGRGIGALYASHRLSTWVKFRGLTAPLLQALRAPHPIAALAIAGATVIGRLEGLVRWTLIEGRQPAQPQSDRTLQSRATR